MDYVFAVGEGVSDALSQKSREIGDRIRRDHADSDLGGTRVKSCAHGLAAMVGDAHQRARSYAVGGDDVRAVDPDVSGFEAGGTAGGDLYFGESGGWGHADIVMLGEEGEGVSRKAESACSIGCGCLEFANGPALRNLAYAEPATYARSGRIN